MPIQVYRILFQCGWADPPNAGQIGQNIIIGVLGMIVAGQGAPFDLPGAGGDKRTGITFGSRLSDSCRF